MRPTALRALGSIVIGLQLVACAASPAGESAAASAASPSTASSAGAPETAPTSPTPAASSVSDDATPAPAAFDDALLALELRDVRSGVTFTLGELAADAPVIVETMAIWCTNCRQQMHELTAAHAMADFHSVSIDVEPTEVAADLVAYADREGFD